MGNQQPSISGNGDEGSTTIETSYSSPYNEYNYKNVWSVGAMEGVNRNTRQRGYEARDKEEMLRKAKYLHEKGYSQVKIARILGINRGTLRRWNEEMKMFEIRKPGEAGKLANKKYNYNENYFSDIKTPNQAYLVGYILGDGTIFDRKKSKRLILTLAEENKQLLYDIAKELNMKELDQDN